MIEGEQYTQDQEKKPILLEAPAENLAGLHAVYNAVRTGDIRLLAQGLEEESVRTWFTPSMFVEVRGLLNGLPSDYSYRGFANLDMQDAREPYFTDPEIITKIQSDLTAFSEKAAAIRKDFHENAFPYSDEMREAVDAIKHVREKRKLKERPLTAIEESIEFSKRLEVYSGGHARDINARLGGKEDYLFRKITREVAAATKFEQGIDEDNSLEEHAETLLRMEGTLDREVLVTLLQLGSEFEYLAGEKGNLKTGKMTKETLDNLTFVPNKDDASDANPFTVLIDGQKVVQIERIRDFNATLVNNKFLDVSTIVQLVTRNPENLSMVIDLQKKIEYADRLRHIRSAVTFVRDNEVEQASPYSERWLEETLEADTNEKQYMPVRNDLVTAREFAFWVFTQVGQRNTSITSEQLLYELSSRDKTPAILAEDSVEPKKINDSAFEEYRSLDFPTFQITGEASSQVNELMLASNESVGWQEYTIDTSNQQIEKAVQITSAMPTEFAERTITSKISEKEVEEIGPMTPLALPQYAKLNNLTVKVGRTTLENGQGFSVRYHPSDGTYLISLNQEAIKFVRKGAKVSYEATCQLPEFEPVQSMQSLPIARGKLAEVTNIITNAGLIPLGESLASLATKQESLTTLDLEQAIKETLQYTILDVDDTLPKFPENNEDGFLDSLHKAMLGIAGDTNKIRVQDIHARNIGQLLLSKVLPDDVLEHAQISFRRSVRKQINEDGNIEMGRMHNDIQVTYDTNSLIFDVTPEINDNILQTELFRKMAEQNPGNDLMHARKASNKTLEYKQYLTDMFDTVLKNPPDDFSTVSESQLQQTPHMSILPRVATTLTYLASKEKLTAEEIKICHENLDFVDAIGKDLQELGFEERSKAIKRLEQTEKAQNKLPSRDVKGKFLREVLRIAGETKKLFDEQN